MKWIVANDKIDASVEEFDSYEAAKQKFDEWVETEREMEIELNLTSRTKIYLAKVEMISE